MSNQQDVSFQAKELWINISKGGSNNFETVDFEYGMVSMSGVSLV